MATGASSKLCQRLRGQEAEVGARIRAQPCEKRCFNLCTGRRGARPASSKYDPDLQSES